MKSVLISLKEQTVKLWVTWLVCIIIVFLAAFGTLSLSERSLTPIADLTRDIAAVYHVPFYTGILSNIGIMLFSASATICFLEFVLTSYLKPNSEFRYFFLLSGFLWLFMTFDDAFQFHEELFPNILGISENLVYIAYFLFGCFYLIFYRKIILETDYVLLFFSFLSFALSITLDHFNTYIFAEDISKFTGILFLLAYYGHTGIRAFQNSDNTPC